MGKETAAAVQQLLYLLDSHNKLLVRQRLRYTSSQESFDLKVKWVVGEGGGEW